MNIYKNIFLGIFLALFSITPLSAQTADHSTHDMGAMNHSMNHDAMEQSAIYTAKGVVISIDKEAKKIEIMHEAVPSLNWSSMTMRFVVEDLSLLEDINSGDAVSFDFYQSGKEYVIMDIYPK